MNPSNIYGSRSNPGDQVRDLLSKLLSLDVEDQEVVSLVGQSKVKQDNVDQALEAARPHQTAGYEVG